jgi:hypothetical protein
MPCSWHRGAKEFRYAGAAPRRDADGDAQGEPGDQRRAARVTTTRLRGRGMRSADEWWNEEIRCGEIRARRRRRRRVAASRPWLPEPGSGGVSCVVMMQTAELWDLNNSAAGHRLHRPRAGSILVER